MVLEMLTALGITRWKGIWEVPSDSCQGK